LTTSFTSIVTERFDCLNMPLNAMSLDALTSIGTVEPVAKHTPSKPSITSNDLQGPSGPSFTLAERVTVIVFKAPGHGVLWPMFVTKKCAGSGESTGAAISATSTKVSIPHTPKNFIEMTEGSLDSSFWLNRANSTV